MKFTTYTNKGGRKVNEDFIASRYKNGIYCFAVSDGFGKGGSGTDAAQAALNSVLDEFMKNPKLERQALYSYIEAAQKTLLGMKSEKEQWGEMGTAAAVLITDGSRAVWAVTGDCRVYVFRGSRISEVSEDHSVSFEKFERGEIEYSDIRTDADANKLRRALGDRLAWQPDISEVFNISSAYSFLICTDGFWRCITEEDMEKTRLFSLSSRGWLGKMLKKIAPKLESGSDNLSAISITMQRKDSI